MTCCLNPECQQPQNPDDAEFCLSCGTKLIPLLRGRYRVIRPIGQGGFGRTYLAADDDRLKAQCVIKQFSPQIQGTKSLEKAVQLFEQEAVRLYELGEHPQIPSLLAYFEHEKRLYLVQQFIEGQTLLQEMAQYGVFGEQRIREVLAGVLPLLKFVHDHQVIHRDITPSNIIRRKLDKKLVLIDFGVAKLLSAEGSALPGTKIGTEGYAPIEQLRSGKAYPASDIYSLGATCLYLMTQTRPDDLYDPLEGRWLWRERLSQKGGTISEPIAQILDKMLKDLVSERYQSCDAVMRDLRAALSRPPVASALKGVNQAASGQASSRSAAVSARPTPTSGDSSPTQPPVHHPPAPRVAAPTSANSAGRPQPSLSKPPISGQGRRCLHTLTGHSRWVTAVAISSDGQTIASGSLDNTVKLWKLTSGELTRTFTGHTREVNCLAFSPNGHTLASGSDDGTIKIWSLATERLLRTLSGHTKRINSVIFSADGQWIISGSEDRTVRLWKMDTGETLQTFSGVTGIVRTVAISPDGQTIASSGGFDRQIKLWSVRTGEQIRTLMGHLNFVNTLAISSDNKMLFSGSKDKTIRVWNLNQGEMIRSLSGHTDSVNSIALSSNNKFIVSGSSDTTIKLWNLNTWAMSGTLSEHTNAVNSVALSLDGRFLISGSSDNTVKVWQL